MLALDFNSTGFSGVEQPTNFIQFLRYQSQKLHRSCEATMTRLALITSITTTITTTIITTTIHLVFGSLGLYL